MTLTLHHLESSQSFRVLWLLEELRMPHELKVYKRQPDLLAPPEFKAISPLGTSPTITSGDDFALSESNAIMDYILDKATKDGLDTKNLRPALDSVERNDYLFWFHMPPSSMMYVMSTDSLFRTLPQRVPWPISSIMHMVAGKVRTNLLDPRLHAILKLAEKQLQTNEYLAGNFLTAADITAIYPFESAWSRFPELKEQYPSCDTWLQRLRTRPAFKASLEKSGADSVSLEMK